MGEGEVGEEDGEEGRELFGEDSPPSFAVPTRASFGSPVEESPLQSQVAEEQEVEGVEGGGEIVDPNTIDEGAVRPKMPTKLGGKQKNNEGEPELLNSWEQ